MADYEASVRELGGKRYLSGYVTHSAGDWARHYGDAFAGFRAAKARFDPRAQLNPGFLSWEAP
jgi:FAD/FMN-containing dehydrogenase